MDDLGDQGPLTALIEKRSDEELGRLMTNLAGHDLPTLLEAFEGIDHDRPVVFLAYTIKGFGLPLAGHKDNHAGLLTPKQFATYREQAGVREGHEWDRFEGLSLPEDALEAFLEKVPFRAGGERRLSAPVLPVPDDFPVPQPERACRPQQGFGMILNELGRNDTPLAERIVTTSPDVTVSTNLGPWVNRRGLFARQSLADTFKAERIPSTFNWDFKPEGQHIELGIAEMNLFIQLSALGLSHSLFGERLIPIGTLYDPFISRGLDALNYACYQDSRFILAATPSGITLAPEGGAHQSIATPLIGMSQDGLRLIRAGLCGRAGRDHAFRLRIRPARRLRRTGRAHLAARRDRRLDLHAAVDAGNRTAQPQDDAGTRPGHCRWRLLATRTGPECAGDRRLYRGDRAGGDRGGGADGGGSPRCRPARRHLSRPAQCGWTAAQRARERGLVHAPQPYRAASGRYPAPLRHRHRARRPPPPRWAGSAPFMAIARARSAWSISARPAPSPISSGITASTRKALSRLQK